MARTPRRRGAGRTTNHGRQKSAQDGIESGEIDVYQAMLADAAPSSPTRVGEEGRTLKKRRVGGKLVVQNRQSSQEPVAAAETSPQARSSASPEPYEERRPPQTILKDSSDSDDSGMDWEDVDLQIGAKKKNLPLELGDLNLVLSSKDQDQGPVRRKPLTTSEKKLRLDIHKMHLLCLISHAHLRNHWCNSVVVQKRLKKYLPKKALSHLSNKKSESQFQRSRDFMEGVKMASDSFKQSFKITARGIRRPYWADGPDKLAESELPDDLDLPMEKADFRDLASKPEASRDVISQLFCALLRSADIEARLVCSLQPLPFVNASKTPTPTKPKYSFVVEVDETRSAVQDNEDHDNTDDAVTPARISSTSNADFRDNLIRSKVASRLGMSRLQSNQNPMPRATPAKPVPRKRRIVESLYPVYWVEAFNPAYQKWVPVDPVVTDTIGKSTKFEPPASDSENVMSYVVAFEKDGSARDVTRRYAKAPNAKTRKIRVESTKGGTRWWKQVMRLYRRPYPLDRDQVEDAELAGKEAQEEMPKNVQDFKGHPYYALERHLRRNEALHPRRQVGKVLVGKAADGDKKLEPIYRRRDVHTVKSVDSWYRLGREVKSGETPLKHVRPRQKLGHDINDDIQSSEDRDAPGTEMFAGFQTSIYIPPAVVRGRIPKNIYGNLDVYVPTMIPPGAVHITHPDTVRAARLIGIDFADAVVGFEFRGRQGTAVVKGAIVAAEYQETICDIIRGFANELVEEEEIRRGLIALKFWKRFLLGLRIRKRIDGYDIEGEHSSDREEKDDALDDESEADAEEDKASTIRASVEPPDIEVLHPPLPRPKKDLAEPFGILTDENAGGFMRCADTEAGAYIVSKTDAAGGSTTREPIEGGGFIAEESIDDDQRAIVHGALPDVPTNNAADGLRPVHEVSALPGADELGRTLTAGEIEEARLLQELYEAEAKERDDKTVIESVEVVASSMDVDRDHGEAAEESDKGSLLSHDPEDDDADPDWLI